MLFLRLCIGAAWGRCFGRRSFERLVALVPEVVRVAPQEGQQLMPVALGVDLRGHGVLRAGDDDEPLRPPAGGEIALAVVQGDESVRVAVEKQDGQIERRHAGRGIDGCEVQYTSAVSSKIYEVCEYVSKTEHINLFNMVICGQAWFDKLPAEYQEVMKKDFNDCAYNNAQDIIAAQADMEKTLVDNGMTIIDVNKDEFKAAAATAYDELGWTELRTKIYEEAAL